MLFPVRPEKPSIEEVMTYQIAVRHQALETLYKTYRMCLDGKRLAADFGTTLADLHAHARQHRLRQVRSHLVHIENFQRGRTTHHLLDDIERYMNEFDLTFEEIDISEAAFKDLRERCGPRIHPLVAQHARAADKQPHERLPHLR